MKDDNILEEMEIVQGEKIFFRIVSLTLLERKINFFFVIVIVVGIFCNVWFIEILIVTCINSGFF